MRLPDPRSVREVDDAIVEELQFHIEMRTRDNINVGMVPDQARQDCAAAVRGFRRHSPCVPPGSSGRTDHVAATSGLADGGPGGGSGLSGGRPLSCRRNNEAVLAKLMDTLETMARDSPKSPPISEAALAATLAVVLGPPVVVDTVPRAGAADVDPDLREIRVVYSKEMRDHAWSWTQRADGENFPESTGAIHYLPDGKTCVMPVKLQPGKKYEIWLNSENYHNFMDREGRPATPYYFCFQTAK